MPTLVDLSASKQAHPEMVRHRYGLANCELLLFVGRLHREKNMLFLLHASNRLARQRPPAQLLFIGAGDEDEKLRKEASLAFLLNPRKK